jgi:putative membrane protein
VTRAPLPWALIAATVLAQIAYPLTTGTVRDRLTVVTVLLFFATSVTHALLTRGPRVAGVLVVVTAGGGLLVEAAGTATGVPFGAYSYGDTLGPAVLGVPWVIPLAWTMMAWPAWLVACRLVRRTAARVAVGGWALASWDVFLDPQMVAAGHWRWHSPSPTLPGLAAIPVTNYASWLAVALVMMGLLSAAGGRMVHGGQPEDAPMYALYLWTYASSVLAHAAFLGLPASAAWGALVMGPVAIALAATLWRDARRPAG